MQRVENFHKYKTLRKEYEYFIYEKYAIERNINSFNITYTFNLSDKYFFHPTLKIPRRHFYITENMSDSVINNIIFHIGMIELISYWKAACSPKIIIKPHYINEHQINWWKKIYYNGLGEFFYLNSIKNNINDFVEIVCDSKEKIYPFSLQLDDSNIIPIGGGKDSVVTLELLSEISNNNTCLIVNPRLASIETAKTAGYSIEDIIEIQRTIHPKLLELNDKGFLNGHTPFSALLAFVTVLAAIITGKGNIALSNESSANESTVGNTTINHQYSKSLEFEKDFREYVNEYITKDINYYSLLRPLSELQIAKLFSKFPQYFSKFKSCNVGSKTDKWCGHCPKCLFTYIILSPFISQQELINIFGNNLFENESMLFYFNQLIGKENIKPFECIGTIDEVNIALCMTIAKENKQQLPYLLKHYLDSDNYLQYKDIDNEPILKTFHSDHFLQTEMENLLKKKIND